jgi:hypothetical protein
LYVQYKLNSFMAVSKTLYKDIEKILINPKTIYSKSELGRLRVLIAMLYGLLYKKTPRCKL